MLVVAMVVEVSLVSSPAYAAAPVTRADVARTNPGELVAVNVLNNDFDPDGDGFSIVSVTDPPNGTAFHNGSQVVYAPDDGYAGVDTVSYTVRDTNGEESTGTLTVWVDTAVTSNGTHPDANTDYFVAYQGNSVTFTTTQLLSNDSDPQDQALTVVAVSEPNLNGTLTGNLATGYTYTPNTTPPATDNGFDINLFYLVADPDGHVTQGTITIRLLPTDNTNQPPVAVPDWAVTEPGQPVAVNVLNNDFDPDGDGFSIVSVTDPPNGTAFHNSSQVNYTPNTGYAGTETITYTIRDTTSGLLATGTLTVWVDTAVTSNGTHPDANTDYFVAYQGNSVTFTTTQLLSNDSDPQDQALTVVAVSEPNLNGTLTGNLATGYTYTPNTTPPATDNGFDINLFYLVADPDGHVTQGTITIRLLPTDNTNQPPVAVPDWAVTEPGQPVAVNVLNNDFDPDGDGFSIVSVTDPPNGTAFHNSSQVNYTPNTGYAGTETITYTIRDTTSGLLATSFLAVAVGVTGNAPPVAQSASYQVQANSTLPITLQAVDPNGTALTWRLVTEPAGQLTGSLTGAAPQLVYTPTAGTPTDAFVYSVSDGVFETFATITIQVLRANVAPIANPDTATTTQETPVVIDVVDNDTDADGDPLVVAAATGATRGSVSCSGGECTYTPGPGVRRHRQLHLHRVRRVRRHRRRERHRDRRPVTDRRLDHPRDVHDRTGRHGDPAVRHPVRAHARARRRRVERSVRQASSVRQAGTVRQAGSVRQAGTDHRVRPVRQARRRCRGRDPVRDPRRVPRRLAGPARRHPPRGRAHPEHHVRRVPRPVRAAGTADAGARRADARGPLVLRRHDPRRRLTRRLPARRHPDPLDDVRRDHLVPAALHRHRR
jgi:hypothetical protein